MGPLNSTGPDDLSPSAPGLAREENDQTRATAHHAPRTGSFQLPHAGRDLDGNAVMTNWEILRFSCRSSFSTYAICSPAPMLEGDRYPA